MSKESSRYSVNNIIFFSKLYKTNWFTYRFTFRESHDGTSSNTVNNQHISCDSQGYLHPGTNNHYHSIVSVYNIIKDKDLDDERTSVSFALTN